MSKSAALSHAADERTTLSTLKFRSARTLEAKPACLIPDYSKRATFAANDLSLDTEVRPPRFLQRAHACDAAAAPPASAAASTPPPLPALPISRAADVHDLPPASDATGMRWRSLAAGAMKFLLGAGAIVCLAGVSAAGALITSVLSDARSQDPASPALRVAFASPAAAANIRLGEKKLIRRRQIVGALEASVRPAMARVARDVREREAKPEEPSGDANGASAAIRAGGGARPEAGAVQPPPRPAAAAEPERVAEKPPPKAASVRSEPTPDAAARKKAAAPAPTAKAPVRKRAESDEAEARLARRMQLGGAPARREAPRPAERKQSEDAPLVGQPHPDWAKDAFFRD